MPASLGEPMPSERRPPSRRSRAARAELLLDLTNRVAAAPSLNAQLETLVEIATGVLAAERGSLFLNDPVTGELYARVAQGRFRHEIRIRNTHGVAGHVYTTGIGLLINDPYADERFDRTIDEQTGFVTRNILCAPIRTLRGEVIGVTQTLNREGKGFNAADLELLQAMNQQAAVLLQSTLFKERIERPSRKLSMTSLPPTRNPSKSIAPARKKPSMPW